MSEFSHNLSACPLRDGFQDNKALSLKFDEMIFFPVETGQWILKGQLTQKHMFSRLSLVVSINADISSSKWYNGSEPSFVCSTQGMKKK